MGTTATDKPYDCWRTLQSSRGESGCCWLCDLERQRRLERLIDDRIGRRPTSLASVQ